jgi:hypothetical protein
LRAKPKSPTPAPFELAGVELRVLVVTPLVTRITPPMMRPQIAIVIAMA